MTSPTAIVEHQLPGRVRLRIPSKRGDTEWFRSVIQHLADDPNVHEARANPETGSLLFRHTGLADRIALLASDILDVRWPVRVAPAPRSNGASAKDGPLLDAISAGLTGLGVYQLTQGRLLGNAVEHFWHAHSALRVLESPGLAVTFAAFSLLQFTRGQLLGPAASLFFYAIVAHRLALVDGTAARADDMFQSTPTPEATDLADQV
jgi:hypothetical protein